METVQVPLTKEDFLQGKEFNIGGDSYMCKNDPDEGDFYLVKKNTLIKSICCSVGIDPSNINWQHHMNIINDEQLEIFRYELGHRIAFKLKFLKN